MYIKFYIKSLAVSFVTLALLGCGEEEEAKKIGFSSVIEMKEIQAKGWHTMQRYDEDRAKASGFASVAEMRKAEETKRKEEEAIKKEKELAAERQREAAERLANAEKYCKKDWKDCLTPKMMVDNYDGMPKIRSKCEKTTESMAKWDMKFMNTTTFSSYFTDEESFKKDKTLRLLDHDVKFQNGFGAWKKQSIVCHYSLENDVALIMER